MKRKPKLAIAGLTACSGCQLTFLNCEREIPTILDRFQVSFFPLGESSGGDDERFDAALIEGAVSTAQDLATLFALRRASRLLIAFGTCALFGGVAAMNNQLCDRAELFRSVYGREPEKDLIPPAPFTNFVAVDFSITGCPPEKTDLVALLGSLLAGTLPPTTCYPVCMECRSRENSCLLLDRDELCLGPIIQGGCNARCPATGIVCEGCRGPVSQANVAQEMELLLERGFDREDIRRRMSRFTPGWNYEQRD
ncbi:NADH-quinone oxidoreductase subunit B family protein [Geomesophilobacter sediminis]|uniref:NADH:ubiquinone oxidoreductase n=1 Tax=Geomesophilobacter sediminis TaxID=2798584 RepID=A0A8J7JDH3_9BACT|nr:NADH:ubiquinone oxidoreductase [Geomesophilobacter sediminis]MBJ6723624.1 NADH:ubiquinone oxidoreductase [Geomesophilobacter sediminis]